MKPGSHNRAAEVAARAFLQTGATQLGVKIASWIASFGDTCFQNDSVLREAIRRWDGRKYHRGSIGRNRRLMAKNGWITSVRVKPNDTPWKARDATTCGTTSKSINWKNLGIRNPLTKGERRDLRQKQRVVDRASGLEAPRRRAAIALEPGLVDLTQGIGQPAPSRRRRAPTMAERVTGLPARVVRQERERVEESDAIRSLSQKKEAARLELEQWARDNEERGPP